MGTFPHSITLLSASGDARETVEALVDTGSTFTCVPAPVLERLGATSERTVTLELANGDVIQRPLASVRAELDGVEGVTPCLFGQPGDAPIIGAVTLEGLLLAPDPVRRRLVPVRGLWMQQALVPKEVYLMGDLMGLAHRVTGYRL